ncbi:MAG: hypothetical protein EHM35_09400, partial [Planctomycetaceae bacterium]
MVVEELVSLKLDMLDRLEHRMDSGETLDDAVGAVQQEIISERKSKQFVEEFGYQTIRDLWRLTNRGARGEVLALNGSRRHDPEPLNTGPGLLDAIYKAGDEWRCLGDCTKPMCEHLRDFFHAQAAGNMREAYMFEQLAKKLHKEETVRARFTEE